MVLLKMIRMVVKFYKLFFCSAGVPHMFNLHIRQHIEAYHKTILTFIPAQIKSLIEIAWNCLLKHYNCKIKFFDIQKKKKTKPKMYQSLGIVFSLSPCMRENEKIVWNALKIGIVFVCKHTSYYIRTSHILRMYIRWYP